MDYRLWTIIYPKVKPAAIYLGCKSSKKKVAMVMFTKKNFATCGVSEVFGNYGSVDD